MNDKNNFIHVFLIITIGILLVTVGVLGYKLFDGPKVIPITEQDNNTTEIIDDTKTSKKISAKEVVALVDKYYKPFQGIYLLPDVLDHVDTKIKNSLALSNISDELFEVVDIKKDLNNITYFEYSEYCQVNNDAKKISPKVLEEKYNELFADTFNNANAYYKDNTLFTYINNIYVQTQGCFGPSPERWNYKAVSYEEVNDLLIVTLNVYMKEDVQKSLIEQFEYPEDIVKKEYNYNVIFEKINGKYVLASSYKTQK